MNTPICDFVRRYADNGALRLHMPGHKGAPILGFEHLDITEISGADSLYEASGIIAESEANASALFGCPTFYSTEGSSQCIRAMLYLALLDAKSKGKVPVVAAGRNVHKTFLSAAALLDLDVRWLLPEDQVSYLSCDIRAEYLDRFLTANPVSAVYVTNPDYLGHVTDIAALSAVCHQHECLLLVDNAHGAYLRFLEPSRHPMDLGADLCCDSAHKTLPVLTGGAYLHTCPELATQAKNALALFGSTSPSYLILQSLDAANAYLAAEYRKTLSNFCGYIASLKNVLSSHGFTLYGQEPLKLTMAAKTWGYLGTELAALLERRDIVCEFADPDYLVLMLTPETGTGGLSRLENALLSIPRRDAIPDKPPVFHLPERVLSIREAVLSPGKTVPISESLGHILASATVGCPPAVPILVCGERIDDSALACFRYYGIENCNILC